MKERERKSKRGRERVKERERTKERERRKRELNYVLHVKFNRVVDPIGVHLNCIVKGTHWGSFPHFSLMI